MRILISELLDKKPDFCSLSFFEQVKYMAYIYVKTNGDSIFTPKNISDSFDLVHLSKPVNISDTFNKLVKKNVFIPQQNGYVLHRDHHVNLESEFSIDKPKIKMSKALRDLVPKINDENKKKFLEEAISCYEINSFRAAIIMIWLLVIDHLYDYIINNKLSEFNLALKKYNPKLKEVRVKNDFSEIEESKFIEICRSANIFTKDVRKILDEKLGIRNSCAHPNNIKTSESKATSFIEDLIENVMLQF